MAQKRGVFYVCTALTESMPVMRHRHFMNWSRRRKTGCCCFTICAYRRHKDDSEHAACKSPHTACRAWRWVLVFMHALTRPLW